MMLMVGFGYSNNLVFFVCFFLTSFGTVAMVFTNQNLKKLDLQNFGARPFFADERGEFFLSVLPRSNHDLINITVKYETFQKLIEKIPAKIESSITLPIKNSERGLHKLPTIRVESSYPFQLCRSWKIVCPLQEYLVYPSRLGSPHFPGQADGSNKNKLTSKNNSDEDFGGVKIYEKSDSPRRIDWKSTARTREMQVKMFDSKEGQTLIFRWEQTQELTSFEARISQLALWIDLAEKSRSVYQLILPGFKSELSQGLNHWQSCLKSLALLDSAHVST
ncbi:MAG: DUF58 domain-containing protein [Bdellovibrionales bacterium]|nr:DUF58 domain-containing protein [Bdellovibrionales bacterium]